MRTVDHDADELVGEGAIERLPQRVQAALGGIDAPPRSSQGVKTSDIHGRERSRQARRFRHQPHQATRRPP